MIAGIIRHRKGCPLSPSEQPAMLPFQERIAVRNPNRHYIGSSTNGDCHICGGSNGTVSNCTPWYENMCERCRQRYKEDLANGWAKTLPQDIDPKYQIVLWRFQQCVLIDLLDGVVSETAAEKEMEEVVEVARKGIAEIKRQEAERTTWVNEQKTEQQKLRELSRRLL